MLTLPIRVVSRIFRTSLLWLGHELEGNQEPEPITDATATYQYTDRKVMFRDQEKRMALGHKQDEHEEAHRWEQSM